MIPIEWLNELIQERDGYRRLLTECGSLPAAAYRLARAKCLSHEQSTHVPTRLEVRAAARTIAKNVSGVRVPELSTLANDLEALGLAVL
ncbi:MAG: hypothetical protein IT378_27245 [Sandaracinaceae bacterium]|nr:hypothetical protein [Sandaracinaceae bacterium]